MDQNLIDGTTSLYVTNKQPYGDKTPCAHHQDKK